MNTEHKIIPEDAKCLAERFWGKYRFQLYLWQDSFYEVRFDYGDEYVFDIKPLYDINTLDLYIEAMFHPGEQEPCDRDQYDNLNETGRYIASLLKTDYWDFYQELLWDEKLQWYCIMIEVRAAYLVDEIKTSGMKITEARDIAIQELLKGEPKRHFKPPYIKLREGNKRIRFPRWTRMRRSMTDFLIDDVYAYGNGISQMINWLYEFGCWENETCWEYSDE